jgi:NAD(P)-dependent dehydrogenase (short-subunit alcohol dehydrogenase family)
MNLGSKHILIFGGDLLIVKPIIELFKKSETKYIWINDEIHSNSQEINSLEFAEIKNVHSYEQTLGALISGYSSFDGVIFALSEGSLRPVNMTKPAIASKIYEVNCLAFIELSRILLKKKLINNGASIVAFSSISSLLGLKTKLAYATSKAALNSAVLNLASELSEKKIRVNAILKGALTTDINLDHVKDMFAIGSDTSGSSELGMTDPEELANLAVFLLSDLVKTMTGALLKLDGGFSL